jgi:Protein of unknown function (DUF3631)
MAKNTPEQHFRDLYNMANDEAAAQNERDKAERSWKTWLKRRKKTGRDIGAVLLQAEKDDKKQNPPPPPPDPRMSESVQYDPERHNPASLVENLLKLYVAMSEHVRVIYALYLVYTHVYERFSIVPRVVLTSKKSKRGKTIAESIGRELARRPNEEATGTGAAIEEHYASGEPGTFFLDETQYLDADARRRIERAWNQGFQKGPASKISKMVGGKKRIISLYGPMILAGVGKGIGRLLGEQQRTRTLRLEMQEYTAATKPPRDWYIEEDIDWEALRAGYTLVCRWVAKVKLNPRPVIPAGIIGRDADNIRGMLAVADDCGGEWPWRAREAFMILLEQQRAEDPVVVILRHGLAIFDMLEIERIKTTEFDKELRRLDEPGMDWSRYRGMGGDENEHPIRPPERAELLRESGIKTKVMKPLGGGKSFRGLERSWFVEALREYEPAAAAPRLRLIAPQSD